MTPDEAYKHLRTWEEVEAEIDAYHQTRQYQVDQYVYKVRHFLTSPLRWRYHIKTWYQRANRGYADSDMWNFDGYMAGAIAAYLRWQMEHGHSVSMHYSDDYDTPVDIMVLRRNKEYREIAEIFEEYAKNGHAHDQEWKDLFGGVLDSDLDRALEWLSKHYTSLWD